MASSKFGLSIEHRPSSFPLRETVTFPSRAATRNQTFGTPTTHELDEIQWGSKLTGPSIGASGIDTPSTPKQLEDSRTSSPIPLRGPEFGQLHAEIAHSFTYPYMNRWRVTTAGLAFFIQGLLDSATGALLPSIEVQYHASYGLVSLIFVAQAIGFIAAAVTAHWLVERFGRAKVLSSCASTNVLSLAALVCAPPFAVVFLSFLFAGFGTGTILSLDNVFIVNLRNGTVNLSYMHGLYGIGGIAAPFLATVMVSNGIRWSFFYLIPLGVTAVVAVLFGWSFKGYEADTAAQCQKAILERTISRQSVGGSIWKKSLHNRTTILGAVFILAYQGAEVCISGWVISFLIYYRHGDPTKVGYVTSGFWGGITLGRFVLTQGMHKIGERITVGVLIAATAVLQLVVWLVPNIIGNSVVVAIVGFLLGPMYPCAAGVITKLLPSELHVSSMSFISSMGMTGGALAPLFTGLLAQRLGTVVLNPICLVLYVFMEGAWIGLPRISKRSE